MVSKMSQTALLWVGMYYLMSNLADSLVTDAMIAFAFDTAFACKTVILISGDSDFVFAVKLLKSRGIKVVVIMPKTGSFALKKEASFVHLWRHNVSLIAPPPKTMDSSVSSAQDSMLARDAAPADILVDFDPTALHEIVCFEPMTNSVFGDMESDGKSCKIYISYRSLTK